MQHPALEQVAEERAVALGVARARLLQVPHRAGLAEQRHHRADPLHAAARRLAQPGLEPRAAAPPAPRTRPDPAAAAARTALPPSRAGSRRASPPGTRRPPARAAPSRRAARRTRRPAGRRRRSSRGSSGRAHAEPLLRAAPRHAEAGDHLVEDEQRAGARRTRPAGPPGIRARAGRRPCSRRPARRSPRRPSASSSGTALYGAHDRVRGDRGGHARRRGDPQRLDARSPPPRAARRHARGSSRRTSRSGRARSPRGPRRSALIVASVPEETSRTISIDGTASADLLGQLDLGARGRAPKVVPSAAAARDGPQGLGIGMPEEQRPPGLDPVHVAPAVDGPRGTRPRRAPRRAARRARPPAWRAPAS